MGSGDPATTGEHRHAAKLDRPFWLAILLATVIVISRALLITHAHSPMQDDQWHVRYGLSMLRGDPTGLVGTSAENPPLGQMLAAVPLLVTGSLPEKPMNPATLSPRPLASEDPGSVAQGTSPELLQRLRAARRDVFFGHNLSPETLRLLIAFWKSLLFIPAAGLVFHWCRRLYGTEAGWLAMALVLIDPAFTANTPMPTNDVLAAEGALFASYFAWRLMEHPARRRAVVTAGLLAAAALTMKFNTIILPAVIIAMAIPFAFHVDRLDRAALRRRTNALLACALVACLGIWAITRFDISTPALLVPPPAKDRAIASTLYRALEHPWPAGSYIRVLWGAVDTNASDRWAYLWGQARRGGWWYYFPAVAWYKVPLGFFLIAVLAIAGLRRFRPAFPEWSLAIPALAWLTLLLFLTHLNIGFRHFLPAYIFLLMLTSRALATGVSTVVRLTVWVLAALSFAHTLTFHPDYVSYFSHPVEKPWLLVSDSNIDGGQGLKEIAAWLDAHPTGRPVYLRYDCDPMWIDYYLNGRVTRLKLFDPIPKTGLLILSPVWEAGYWDPTDEYAPFRPRKPLTIIGHCLPVYDLDNDN